jgi:histidinol-phosphate aminotransferase
MNTSKSQPAPIRYQAGAHIAEIEKLSGLSQVIKLASNENPLGPSPLVLAALQSLSNLHRYPDDKNVALKQVIAQRLQLESARLLISNGTTHLIDTIVQSLCAPDDEILLFEKTFIYYRISAQNHHINYEEVSRGPGFAYDVDKLISKISQRTRLVFIAAPDNPTSVYVTKAELERILAALPERAILIFDEAYREYVPAELYFDPALLHDPRLLILRTFSKIYGLAGFRCGYAIGDPAMIEALSQIQAPFSVSAVAQAVASAALLDEAHLERSRRLNQAERERLTQALSQNEIPYIKGCGNFITINTFPLTGEVIYKKLLSRGVIIRPLDVYGLDYFIRVTIGLPEENQCFLQQLLSMYQP